MRHKKTLLSVLPVALVLVLLISGAGIRDKEEGFTFAFLPDIHIQPELQAVEGFKKAIKVVNERKPDFVILGGDMIMDANDHIFERSSMLFDLLLKTTKEFTMPVYYCIGNHELFGTSTESGVDPSHPLYGKKMYLEKIGKTYYSFDHKGRHFMILDSIALADNGTITGGIDQAQLKWIKEDLVSVDRKTPIVVCVHMPFITLYTQLQRGSCEENTPGLVIVNSKEVLALFEEHNLELVLQAHLHLLEEMNARGKSFITAGAVSGNWWKGPLNGLEEGFLLVKCLKDGFDWKYVDFAWEAESVK